MLSLAKGIKIIGPIASVISKFRSNTIWAWSKRKAKFWGGKESETARNGQVMAVGAAFCLPLSENYRPGSPLGTH
ncbi:MAG: hypothetical protein RIM83_08230 [Allomuricauda sp.]|jgi:hypothetical protein|uniref:hypothetical protein n=1 Tax=Allomuricauda sp. CP2A TaxID=1848189 RepID=UPI000829DC60|nr:hypothetical protein [Muricauda sp. CP2A]